MEGVVLRRPSCARNLQIRLRYTSGEASVPELAVDYGLSKVRVWKILSDAGALRRDWGRAARAAKVNRTGAFGPGGKG